MILRMPFLERENPLIDWKAKSLEWRTKTPSIFPSLPALSVAPSPALSASPPVPISPLSSPSDSSSISPLPSSSSNSISLPTNPTRTPAPSTEIPSTSSSKRKSRRCSRNPRPAELHAHEHDSRPSSTENVHPVSVTLDWTDPCPPTPPAATSSPAPRPFHRRLPVILPTRQIHPQDQLLAFTVVDVTEPKAAVDIALDSPAVQVNAVTQSNVPTSVPLEYAEYADVFEEKNAEFLPPHCPNVDHEIPIVPGAKPVFGPIYNLSETELQYLKDYIDRMLARGWIRPSKSPFGSPILFVKKADGSLRLVVDYRKLNTLTVKNRYPLPFISELFDRLKNAKYYTHLDMQDAYNQLRVAPGDE